MSGAVEAAVAVALFANDPKFDGMSFELASAPLREAFLNDARAAIKAYRELPIGPAYPARINEMVAEALYATRHYASRRPRPTEYAALDEVSKLQLADHARAFLAALFGLS